MATIRRINLSFDIDRPEDCRAYKILRSKRNKTAHVIDIILASSLERKINIDKDELKQVIREVFKEMNVTTNTEVEKESSNTEDIPQDVFDIISSI